MSLTVVPRASLLFGLTLSRARSSTWVIFLVIWGCNSTSGIVNTLPAVPCWVGDTLLWKLFPLHRWAHFLPLCGSARSMSESCYKFPLVLLALFVAVIVDCIFHFTVRMWHVVGRWLEKHIQGPLTLHYFTLPESWGLCQQDFDIQWTLVTKSCLGKGVFPPHAELAGNSRVGFFVLFWFFASLFLETVHYLWEDSSHQKPQMRCRK